MTLKLTPLSSLGGGAVSGLGETNGNGWDVQPGRLVPLSLDAIEMGQNFSDALNAALAKHSVPGRVQTDGPITRFHIELLGDLLLMPGVGSVFVPEVADQALELATDPDLQEEVLFELDDRDLVALTESLKRAATLKPGQQVAPGGAKSGSGLAVPLAIGSGLLILFLAVR